MTSTLKTARIGIILTDQEKQMAEDAAWKLRISLSEYIRLLIRGDEKGEAK